MNRIVYASLSIALCLGLASFGQGADLDYDYEAGGANDSPPDNTWETETSPGSGRQWGFAGNTNPADTIGVVSPGTAITEAYDFGGGLLTDPKGATVSSFKGSDLDAGGNSPAAFEMWVNPDTTSGNQVLFETGGNTRGASMLLEGTTAQFNTIGSGGGGGSQRQAIHDLGSTPSDFTQLVGVVDFAKGQTRLYVDGQLETAVGGTSRWDLGTDGAGLGQVDGNGAGIGGLTGGQEGSFGTGSSVRFDGKMGRVRFYSGETTALDVYNAYVDLAPSGEPYANEVLADNPVGYWRLGEDSSPNASNLGSADSAAEGTYTNGPTLGQPGLLVGSSNTAVGFDGSNQHVVIDSATPIDQGQPFENKTAELLFNADTTGGRQVLWVQGGGTRGTNMYLDGDQLHVQAWNDNPDSGTTPWGGGGDLKFAASESVSTGETHHAALVFEGRTDGSGDPQGQLTGYLDGVPFGQVTGVGRLFNHGQGKIAGAGGTSYFYNDGTQGAQNAFDGGIDEVAHFSDGDGSFDPAQSLSVEQIQDRYLLATGGTLDHGQYGNQVLADDPIAYYYAGGVNVATDNTTTSGLGSAVEGDPTNGVSNEPGLVMLGTGPASGFNGTNGLIAIPNDPAINTSDHDQRTIELVFSADSPFDRQVLYEEGGGTNGFNLYVEDGELVVGAWRNSTGPTYNEWLSTEIETGRNHHAALVFDSSGAGTLTGYLDGVPFDSVAVPDLMSGHGGLIAIGAMRNDSRFLGSGGASGDGFYFAGLIDDVALYNDALSADRIRSHALLVIPEPATLVVWSLLAALGIGLGWRRRRA